MTVMKIDRKLFIGFLTFVLCEGCKKFVEIPAPTTQLVTASVFNDNSAATSAQTSIYSQMVANSESYNTAFDGGLLSDELTNYSSNLPYIQLYTNALTAAQQPGPWNNGYNYIYQANAIIAAVQGNSSLNSAVAQQLLGESKFIRAFWFFYLVNFYGDIPLVTSTDYSVNATIGRKAKSEIYAQIVSDLKDSKSLLNPRYIDASDTMVTTTDRTRPNKWAASALLSRAYLYTGDYADAETEADSVINNALYSLCPSLDSVFLVNSTEAIWQLGIPLPASYNTPDGYRFILLAAPGNSLSYTAIAPQLLSSFEVGDTRRIHWIDSFPTTTTPYYYPFKYKVQSGAKVVEDVMVLRLAEQYLIRAEARAKDGNIAGAISDLNMIRLRANLDAYAGLANQQSVLTAILHERQVELFTEWGHRWFDLIRTNSADSVMGVVTPLKGGTWSTDDHQLLFPIPQDERKADVNLTQNMGY
jgi:starch-binding outer membrane protein, SusD/RagB family